MVARKLKPKPRECTAFHEAGHAVIRILEGLPVRSVTIKPTRDSHGAVDTGGLPKWFKPDAERTVRLEEMMRKWVRGSCAGPLAQRKHRPSSVRSYHAMGDIQQSLDLLEHFVSGDRELDAYWRLLNVQAENLVETHWSLIEKVSHALLVEETVSGQRLRALMFERCG